MILTSKGRYAVMALVDMALNKSDRPMTLAAIAERQSIDLGYLEQLFSKLKRMGIVRSIKGPGGGYVLNKESSNITISEVLCGVDENIKMTRCEGKGVKGCMNNKSRCITHHLWEELEFTIFDYLNKVTLDDVCKKNLGKPLSEAI